MSRSARAVAATLIGAVTLTCALALALAPSDQVEANRGPGVARTTQVDLAVPAATTHRHFIVNLHGSVAPRRLGFNIFDTSPSVRAVRALPRGVRALVWLGQKCPTRATARFRATVRRLSSRQRVVGYYLSDEPHIADCPGGPAGLASRTRFIHRVSHGRQKTFVILSEPRDLHPFRPAVTGLDLVGLDPYPCSVSYPHCALWKIDREVRLARARGIPLRKIVPVYQAFGQGKATYSYYRLPTADQFRRLLVRWRKLVPSPWMDYTYTWGHQPVADPTLVDSAALKAVLKTFFAR